MNSQQTPSHRTMSTQCKTRVVPYKDTQFSELRNLTDIMLFINKERYVWTSKLMVLLFETRDKIVRSSIMGCNRIHKFRRIISNHPRDTLVSTFRIALQITKTECYLPKQMMQATNYIFSTTTSSRHTMLLYMNFLHLPASYTI